MKPLEQFLKERKYLKNVSARTVEFYEDCRKAVEKFGDFSEDGLKKWVIASREAGFSARSINTRITGINAYPFRKGVPDPTRTSPVLAERISRASAERASRSDAQLIRG